MSVSKSYSRLLVTCLTALMLTGSILFFSKANEMPLDTRSVTGREVVWRGVDPGKVMGARACSQCHRSEMLAWKKMAHHTSHLLLYSESARDYARAIGIDPASVRKADACVRCHATAQATFPNGIVRAVTGVSCESCHGEAGGEAGWLNVHAVYGPNGTTFERESVTHRTRRLERGRQAGMIQSGQLYESVMRCLNCHLVRNEALVNAGHSIGREFEFVGRTSGEIRHNFHEDQFLNAIEPTLWQRRTGGSIADRRRKKFVVGILTELESSLLAFSRVTDADDYSESLIWRAKSAWEKLKETEQLARSVLPADLKRLVASLKTIADLGGASKSDRGLAAAWSMTAGNLARRYARSSGVELQGLDPAIQRLADECGEAFERQ